MRGFNGATGFRRGDLRADWGRAVWLAIALSLSAARGELQAQFVQPRAEVRTDLIAARATAVHLGTGVSVVAGSYTRAVFLMGVGASHDRGTTRVGGRGELLLRFHLDPFRQAGLGFYGTGGVGGMYDRFERWRALMLLSVGVELPAHARGVWALEVGVGGGVRFGVALRRSSPQRR